MQAVQEATTVQAARRAAVAETIGQIRTVERERGVTREALDEIRAILLKLAANQDLFPEEEFEAKHDEQGRDAVYKLAADSDERFALYMSTALTGKKVPPHDHTTWAVIVGVRGEEENFFYERADGGTNREGPATIKQVGADVVRPGTGVCLMPDDIHHIQVTGDKPTMHLHMYGLALEALHGRVFYDVDAGVVKPTNVLPNLIEAR
jgi:predicted metal-dependent enzyme (double-stranded beta helix superfamily)